MENEFEIDNIAVELVGGPRDGQTIYLDPEDWRVLNGKTRFLEWKRDVFELTGDPLPLTIEGINYFAEYDQTDGKRILRATLRGG